MNKNTPSHGSMIRDIPVKVLLVCSFLVSGLIPIMIVSLIGFNTAKVELKEQAFRQLESVRNIKKEQIKNFFSERINNITVFAKDPYIIDAYRDLKKVFDQMGGVKSKRFKGFLEEAYDAPAAYKKKHDRYFPFLKNMIRQYGYYDFFFMDPIHGDTIFTVRKESDFGIRIGELSSSLRDVWLKSCAEKRIALSDTKPYPPSHNAPAQFLAAPIIEDETIIGVVAVQISIDSIDRIMTERSGMWKTGETYLVGPDKKMRSNSYMDHKYHSVYASFNGSVEKNGVKTIASRNALAGITDTGIIVNYRGQEVLSSYTPIDIEGVIWAMIAEIDLKEIEGQIAGALNTKIILLFIISLVILLLLSLVISIFISHGINNTIQQLENMIKSVLNGELRVRGDEDSVGVDFKKVVHSANLLIDAFAGQWEEKRKLEEHIQYNQKLKAIGTLAGGIAHDFNNILTSMFAYSYIVMAELPDGSPVKENMEEIVASIRRASELVDQILTFGRHVKTEKKVAEILKMVIGAERMLTAMLPKNIIIKNRLPKEPIYIAITPSQFNQILMNLCINAAYAMQEAGGILEISLDKKNNSSGEIPGLKKKNYCKLSVCDTGIGIDPGIIDRIFEPFFTSKPLGQGSGMGLAIVYGIVLNSGGKINVESEPGKGARFDVYLPMLDHETFEEKKFELHESISCEGKHILFVDDEIGVCQSESRVLESLGYKVTPISDEREVEKVFMDNPDQFDLVITDLNMPHMNGIELSRRILALRPDIPIILTTGHSDYDKIVDHKKIEETGIMALLKKPYEEVQLSRLIAQALKIKEKKLHQKP
jgi:signal transduction histidine kinase/CheY-like chemotaxis protein